MEIEKQCNILFGIVKIQQQKMNEDNDDEQGNTPSFLVRMTEFTMTIHKLFYRKRFDCL